ncbi:MAG: histidinol dehydrogenase [Gracilimonas sp.]|nr:histidinol dehydrogenase [Gracilimonas sp.]
MKTYNYSDLSSEKIGTLLKQPKIDFTSIFQTVQPIIDAVEKEGDEAVKRYTEKFDKVVLSSVSIDPQDLEVKIDESTKEAIDIAFQNIVEFHKAQQVADLEVETMPGVRCLKVTRPVERVGLYVPGGTAILPSTAMMLSIPAMIAGCTTKVLATPPRKDGSVASEIIYIAQRAGVDKILLAGGAQAVAAMAIGTETVPKVDKIFRAG